MLYNITNHPSSNWGDVQLKLAKDIWGDVVDVPFPEIDPLCNEEDIIDLVDDFLNENFPENVLWEEPGDGFLVQGEFTFAFALVKRLQSVGSDCYVATSKRNTVDNPDGSKTINFEFVQFREYPF